MTNTILIAQLVLLCLTLAAAIVTPILIMWHTTKKLRGEASQLISRIDKNLAASVKLLEVRDYYETTSSELKKMLDDAYKEGNRPRQEAIRKMIQRLDTLKARALDKAVKILDGNGTRSSSKRHRKSRRPRRKPRHQGEQNQQSKSNKTNRSNNRPRSDQKSSS